MKKKGFSLMETIIVVIILSILIQVNRIFFSIPSKYIIESEQCVNALHGEINSFLYKGISGKIDASNGSYSTKPEEYSMIINAGYPDYEIIFGFLSTSNTGLSLFTNTKKIVMGSGLENNTVMGCAGGNHWVMLSGGIAKSGTTYPIKITINKKISAKSSSNSMSLCGVNTGSSNYDCIPGSHVFTGTMEYRICKKDSSNASCELFFSQYIDARSQTIFGRKCLSLPLDKPCEKWSIDYPNNF